MKRILGVILCLASILCFGIAIALAQQAPASDEQLQQMMIRALRAELELANALAQRREQEWAQYSKPLWEPSK